MGKSFFSSITAIIIIAAEFAASSAIDEGDSIIGRWYTERKEASFEFFRSGNAYYARLFPLKIPGLIDSLNPVDSLRSRRIAGTVTIFSLTYNPEKRIWEKGKIYNPSDGKTYHCSCRLLDGGKKLQFKGYIAFSALGMTQIWTREEENK